MQTGFELILQQLENKIKILDKELNSLSGQYSLLEKQKNEAEIQLEYIKKWREIYKKEIELFIIIEELSKKKIKTAFESLVTYALRYIYNDDYSFQLEFSKRGNLQQVDMNIKSPEFSKAFDPLDTESGGILDIASLALRIVLLNISRIKGFLIIDECFKHLSGTYLEQAGKFIKAIHQRIGRQIIMITHKEELLKSADKIIEIK